MARNRTKTKSTWVALMIAAAAIATIVDVVLSNQIHMSPTMARMAPWLLARAGGITAYLLLTALVVVGMVLSSVPNRENWRMSKVLLPFHRFLSLFLLAFLALHVAAICLDSYAKVGVMGAFVPLMSSYRTIPVALGTLSFYALLLLAVTARFTRLLPTGRWLTIHRFALITFTLSFLHGVLTGTDSPLLTTMYDGSVITVLLTLFIRYAFLSRRNSDVVERQG